MNEGSGSVPAVIDVSVNDKKDTSINEICDEKEKKDNTNSRVATVGLGTSQIGSFMPLLAMTAMMLQPHGMYGGNPFAGTGMRIREPLRTRECALTGCDTHFTPVKSSEICCSKEHFFILRDKQKEERKKNVN